VPTPADLFVSPDLTEAQARAYLESLGFRDPDATDGHLQSMADDLGVREALGRLAGDLIPSLLEAPDPDAAVAGMAHYLAARSGRAMFVDYLREDPRALHVLTYVMGASPMLSEILIRTPEYFHWLVSQVERGAPDQQDHQDELASLLSSVDDPFEALDALRRWKRREMLRIGTRELLRRDTVQTAAAQLSDVACVAVECALAVVMHQLLEAQAPSAAPGAFAVIATGPLAAGEMSYHSDLELLYVYAPAADGEPHHAAREFFAKVGCTLTAALDEETREGFLYRVVGPTGPRAVVSLQACALSEYHEHYARSSDVLERCELTRARSVAGNAELGRRFVAATEPFVYGEPVEETTAVAVLRMETTHMAEEIERITQLCQVACGSVQAPLRQKGTLAVLEAMWRAGLVDESVHRELHRAYVLLRSLEHRRQLGLREEMDAQGAALVDRARALCRGLIWVTPTS